jgi:hypothetical protein
MQGRPGPLGSLGFVLVDEQVVSFSLCFSVSFRSAAARVASCSFVDSPPGLDGVEGGPSDSMTEYSFIPMRTYFTRLTHGDGSTAGDPSLPNMNSLRSSDMAATLARTDCFCNARYTAARVATFVVRPEYMPAPVVWSACGRTAALRG